MTHSCTGNIKSQFVDDKGNVFLIQTDCKKSPQYLVTKVQTDPILGIEIFFELTKHHLKTIQETNSQFTLKNNNVMFNNVQYIAPYVRLDMRTEKKPIPEKIDENTDFSSYLYNIYDYIPKMSVDFNIKSMFKEYENDILFIKIIFRFMYTYLVIKSKSICVDKQKSINTYNKILYKFYKDGVVNYNDILTDGLFYVFDEDIKNKLDVLKYPIVENVRVSRNHITTSDSSAVNRLYKINDNTIRPYITPKGGFFVLKDDIYSISNINTPNPTSTYNNLEYFLKNSDGKSNYINISGDVYSIVKIQPQV